MKGLCKLVPHDMLLSQQTELRYVCADVKGTFRLQATSIILSVNQQTYSQEVTLSEQL